MTQTTSSITDEILDCEPYQTTAEEEAALDAAEHNLHVYINARAAEDRAARNQQAKENARAARKRARVLAFYRGVIYWMIAVAGLAILTKIGAVSPAITLIVCIAGVVWTCREMVWIIRRSIRLLTPKKEENHA